MKDGTITFTIEGGEGRRWPPGEYRVSWFAVSDFAQESAVEITVPWSPMKAKALREIRRYFGGDHPNAPRLGYAGMYVHEPGALSAAGLRMPNGAFYPKAHGLFGFTVRAQQIDPIVDWIVNPGLRVTPFRRYAEKMGITPYSAFRGYLT